MLKARSGSHVVMPEKTSAFAHGDAFFAECGVVNEFIDASVRPIVDRVFDGSKPEHSTFLGALLRVTAWLRSLKKLNHPGDFQAVVCCSRALLEIAIDLSLLQFDAARHSHDMIASWERSAKFKHAKGVERFYARAGKAVPNDLVEVVNFIAREGAVVDAERRKHWPQTNGAHPVRWTGRSLPDDAREADKVVPHGFVADLNADSFSEFCTRRFAHLCWSTHGSGLAGVRFLSEGHFPGVSALGFAESAQLAVTCVDLLLRLFGRHDEIMQVRFQKLKAERFVARAKVLITYPPALW